MIIDIIYTLTTFYDLNQVFNKKNGLKQDYPGKERQNYEEEN